MLEIGFEFTGCSESIVNDVCRARIRPRITINQSSENGLNLEAQHPNHRSKRALDSACIKETKAVTKKKLE